MRIGIFGGTFDPIHLGHLLMAEQCREQANLEQVWFIPAAQPPHKMDAELSPFDRRVEMLELALAGAPRFRVDRLEAERAGPSYTSETLAELNQRYAEANFFLLLGADCLPDLPKWYQAPSILDQATLLVVPRPGESILSREQLARTLKLEPTRVRLRIVDAPEIGLASHQIRQRVAAGRSIRYMVPHAVEVYIHEKQLYRQQNA